MPRISKVYDSKFRLRYGWMFDIQNYEDLQGYWDNCRKKMFVTDFDEARKYVAGKAHANVLAYLAEMKGIDLLTALSELQGRVGRAMSMVLDAEGRLFVNSLGGYFQYSDGMTVSDTKNIDVWALPEEKVRIIQWPDGKHYYAKIGNEDIEFDGKQKWDTKAEAEIASKKFLEGKLR